ncbi:PAS domain-containing protein, partial [Pleurocapsa sp. CCALA 161]|uniref:hybrid sensor histidine kinase/response regulator n=1 Tax=Pleurocapsa sp. CCALA 161 TaxID=2107688 RepID=UPI001304DE9C
PNTHPAFAFYHSRSVASALTTGQPCNNVKMGFFQSEDNLIWLSLDSQPLFAGNNNQPFGVATTFQDITGEQAQIDSQGQDHHDVKVSAETIPGVLYVFDVIEGRNTYLNSQTYDLLGYTPAEISAMGDKFTSEVMHPQDFAQFPAHLARLERSQSEEVVKLEYRMRHRDGRWRWFSTQDRVYRRSADGQVEQILGLARDISDRKQMEMALKESEERLNMAIVASGTGMWFWDLVEDTLEWTDQCKAIFGMPLEAELSHEKFINTLHPKDRDRTQAAVDQALANQTEYNIEYRVVWADQSIHWIAAKGKGIYNQKGQAVQMIGTVVDVTNLRRSQQQLLENQNLLKLALSSAKAGSWSWDLIQQDIVWSPENYALFGIEPQIQPFRYDDWQQLLHPDDREQSKQDIAQVLSGKSAEFQTEFRIIHPQKGIRWILGLGNVTCDANGQPIRLSGINLDITQLKENEAALRHSQQQLRILLDSLPIFTGFLTLDGVLTEVNQVALDAADLQREDVLNKHFCEAYSWSYDPKIQEQIDSAIKRAAAGEMVRFDVLARVREGNSIVVDFGIVPKFNDRGQVEYLVPFGMNISDREAAKQALKQREHDLKLITQVIPQQIWTAAKDGHLDYINQRWQDYTGFNLEQMRQLGWASIVHPDELPAVTSSWIQAIKTESKFALEIRLRSAEGRYNWFLCKATPLRNEQGEIVKWYGSNTDIAKIKELEQKLLQQTEDLIQANQLKDEFLAIVSHELRTPLNPILGWSQLLLTGRLDADKTAQGFAIIERNAKLQAQLIDDLLDVSKILQNKLNLNKTPVNLESVIDSALTTIQLAIETKSIQIKTELESGIGQVLGDAARLQQIVWNLLTNAVKFTPEQGHIFVRLKRINTEALIEVEDTGRGIEAEFIPYVFDRFRQADSANTREFGGLGLGLAIVRHLSELHGGTVAVSSPGLNQGATFSVSLPVINVPTARHIDLESDRSIRSNRLNDLTILVVDDQKDSLEILTVVLEQEGANVISTRSAAAALAVLNQTTPHVIVSDIGMPHTDGYNLIKQIRQLPQGQIPAIALTAYAREIDRQHSFDAGFNRHIAKPIKIPELITAIAELIKTIKY